VELAAAQTCSPRLSILQGELRFKVLLALAEKGLLKAEVEQAT
jgi:hypothetical protein